MIKLKKIKLFTTIGTFLEFRYTYSNTRNYEKTIK